MKKILWLEEEGNSNEEVSLALGCEIVLVKDATGLANEYIKGRYQYIVLDDLNPDAVNVMQSGILDDDVLILVFSENKQLFEEGEIFERCIRIEEPFDIHTLLDAMMRAVKQSIRK